MPYVTGIERLAREEGRAEGIERGRLETVRRDALAILTIRFQDTPSGIGGRLQEITDSERASELH